MTTVNNLQEKKGRIYAVKAGDIIRIKDVDLKSRTVTGLYNTYNFLDSDNDVILPGAAAKSIAERGPDSNSVVKIKHLMFHDWTMLPGKINVLKEKAVDMGNQALKGLYFETKMSDTTLGTDTLVNYQEGVYDNHSIGFQFLDGEYMDSDADGWKQMLDSLINPQKAQDTGYAYLWKEIKLYEGSTVAFGANELTPFLGVKNAENRDVVALKVLDRIKTLETQLKKGTQSDDMLQTFEMQCKQLYQLISELFMKGPSAKPTSKEPGEQDTDTKITEQKEKEDAQPSGLSGLLTNLKFV